jgi:hypothetical protein
MVLIGDALQGSRTRAATAARVGRVTRWEDSETDRVCGRWQAHLWTCSGEGRNGLGSDGLTGRVGRRTGGARAGSSRRGRIGDPALYRTAARRKAPRQVKRRPLGNYIVVETRFLLH